MAALSDSTADPQRLEAEPQPTVSRPLKLLSLDGGGVRGLSSIIILEHLMDKVNKERKEMGLAPQEPWELFDLIGGTSTGGLIAVMLGRLHMSVKECKDWYIKLAKDAFTPIYSSFNMVGKLLGKIQAKPAFDEKKLENAIQSIILSALQRDVNNQLQSTPRYTPEMADKIKGFNAQDILLYHPDSLKQSCKMFVVATEDSDAQTPLVLRSYKNPYRSRDLIDHCLIWQACRATSAAPTFFAPLTFHDPETGKQRILIDGGIVTNNPVSLVHRESQDMWPNTTPLLISIGTGLKQDIEFRGAALSIARSLAEIATETESTHGKFKNGSGKELANKNKYFRFNVPKIAAIGMEEYQKLADLQKETMDYISNHVALTEACVEKMLETATPETMQRNKSIMRWLSPPFHWSDHSHVGEQIDTSQKPNGLWLLNEHFVPWTKSRNSAKPVFWLRGSVGMGKTCLMYQIIEKCKNSLQPGDLLAFFYCSRAFHDHRDPADILRSILAQLSCSKDFSMIAPGVLKAYKKRQDTDGLDAKFSLKETTNLLRAIVSRDRHHPYTVTIVIDGLDECSDFNKLLFHFKQIFDDDLRTGSLKMVLSSRMNVQQPRNFPSQKEIVILPENNTDDIRAYIECQVSNREKNQYGKRLLDGSEEGKRLEERLRSVLTSKAEGMFLWVKLQLATFFPQNRELRHRKDVEKKIDSLETPSDLDKVYKEVYDANATPDSEDLKVAQSVYKWMLSVKRDFTIEDLVEAVSATDTGLKPLEADYIMKVCANFILWLETGADLSEMSEPNAPDTRVRIVQFTHATVKDYLELRSEQEYTKKSTHGHVAESCLLYLKGVDHERAWEAREERGFLNYALAYWPYHVSEACANGYDIPIAEASSRFTDKEFEEWIAVLRPIARNLSQDPVTQEKLLDCISVPADRIFLACAWNIYDLVKEAIDIRVAAGSWEYQDCNQTNTDQVTPLYLASKYGHQSIVELLIDYGTEIDFECRDRDGALEVASSRGHSKIVKFLLDKGAKVSAHNGEAIRLAASKGHTEILKLLVVKVEEELRNEENFHTRAQDVFLDSMVEGAKSGKGEAIKILLAQKQCFRVNDRLLVEAMKKALIHAADVGSDAVTNRLLEKGANPNFRDESGASPLDIAAFNGHLAVVKSLLPKIPDLTDFGQSALSLATEHDHLTIVKLLLERGVTLHFSQPKDLDILRKAVDKNYSELINLLLTHSREDTYGISLNEAAESGDESVVDLLLLLGATADNIPPLQEQAMDDHFSAIQHLLDHDAQHPQGPSSLQKAAAAGHELIVSLLLKHGAAIEVKPNEDSALHKAVINNHPSVIETLLDYKADVNAPGSSGTPLALAARFGYQQIVDLLLERGADIDAENENGTPLEIAARHGYLNIVKRLISEHGNTTDQLHGLTLIERLNRKGPKGTGLQCAAAGGHREIADLLIAQGADVNIQGGPYGTALQAAIAEGKVDMVTILLRAKATDFSSGGNKRWDRATSAWIPNEQPYSPEPRTPMLTNGNALLTIPPKCDSETLLLSMAAANERQKKKVVFKETASSISRNSSSTQLNGGLNRSNSRKSLYTKDRERGSYLSQGGALLVSSGGLSPGYSPPSPSTPRGDHSRRSSIRSMRSEGY